MSLSIVCVLVLQTFAPNSANAATSKNELIIVNKKSNQLAFFVNGVLIKTFSVATGRTPDLTPEGSFKIVNKIKNRPYYKEKIPGGDPRNPLGDRWLGLEVNGTEGTTYGIHGNNKSSSIGKYVSAGCIRMLNDQIHWLFPQIEIGTPVIVTTSAKSMIAIAEQHDYPVVKPFKGTLLLDGASKTLSHPMLLIGSQVFIPMRDVFEMLGAKVEWDPATKAVTAVMGDRTLTHTPLTSAIAIDGVSQSITASRVVDDAVMLPLRAISELSGYQVTWDAKTQQISIDR